MKYIINNLIWKKREIITSPNPSLPRRRRRVKAGFVRRGNNQVSSPLQGEVRRGKVTFFFSVSLFFIALPALAIDYNLLAPVSEKQSVGGPNIFGDYMANFIPFVLAFAAMAAVVQMVIGGFEYALSEAITNKQEAKDRITSALTGLLLALGSFLILNTINPKLTSLQLTIDPIPTKTTGVVQNTAFRATCSSDTNACVITGAGTTGTNEDNCGLCTGSDAKDITQGQGWCKRRGGTIGPGSCTESTLDVCTGDGNGVLFKYKNQCENAAPLPNLNPVAGDVTTCWIVSAGECTTQLTELQCAQASLANRYSTGSFCPPSSLFTCKAYQGPNPQNCPTTP